MGCGVWMMVKRYRVRLAEEEQQELMALVSRGRAAAYRQTHARILLLCDENQADGAMKDEEIARALKVGTATVERVRRRCVEEGQRTRESLGQVLTDVKQLQSDMAETRTDVRRIDGRLDRGFGTNYEAKVAQNVRSILGQQARVRNSRGLNGPSLRTDPDFNRQVESAEASGAITEDESDELLLLDVIVSGTRTGAKERVYAGIEVSISANDDDVNRASDRAEILRTVTGEPVMATVIAARVDEPHRGLAVQREVAVAVHLE